MITWSEFQNIEKDKQARKNLLTKENRFFYLLFSQQLNIEALDTLYKTATAIRRLNKTPEGQTYLKTTLHGKRVLNLFVQPSTRTAESFLAAAERLGMDSRIIQDLSTSSFAKGETLEDAIQTLSSYFDCIVTRHKDDDFAQKAALAMLNSNREVPIISAGSGSSQHVTQSLLDIYTLQYSFENKDGLNGKTIMIVSDLIRNRAALSLIYLLTKFQNIRIVSVTPKSTQMTPDMKDYITNKHNLELLEFNSVESAINSTGQELDAIYMTRNQTEYEGEGWENDDDHILKWEYKNQINKNCIIMHPLPRRDELPVEWDKTPNSMIWRQVRNGMWIRAAIFAYLFKKDKDIIAEAEREALTA